MAAVQRLGFPTGLDTEAVVGLLAGWSADLNTPGPFRLPQTIWLEVTADADGIEHLLSSGAVARRIEQRLRSAAPAVRLTPVALDDTRPDLAVELRVTRFDRPLRVDRVEARTASLLMALTGLRDGERLVLRWLLTGAGPQRPPRRRPANLPAAEVWFDSGAGYGDSEALRAARAKQNDALLLGVCRIGVVAASAGRRRQLIGGVVRALQAANAPGVALVVRQVPSWVVVRRMAAGFVPRWSWPLAVNAAELAALIGWPVDSPQIPGLQLGASRQLLAERALRRVDASAGVVIGESTFPGHRELLVLSEQASREHLHVIGPTGVGKSHLLGDLARQYMARGHAVIVLDAKNDLVTDVLDHVPARRRDNVIVLDPADTARPVGFNPLRVGDRTPDLVVDQVVSVIHDLFRGSWGPRTDDVLRASLATLLAAEVQYTLAEVPLLLSDPGFRRRLTAGIDDPVALGPFWAWYEQLSPAERAAVTGPVLNKLRAFLMRPPLRAVLGQGDPAWSIDDVMARRRILLVPLSAGQIGDQGAHLLGSLIVAGIWQATQARSAIPAAKRRPVVVIIDEFQHFVRLPTNLGDMLAAARGLGVAMTLAHQHLGQLSAETRADVLADARSRVVFQTGHRDAQILVRDMAPLEAQDLQHLGRYEIAVRLSVGGHTTAPASARTLPLPAAVSDGTSLRAAARMRWGRPLGDVDAEILARRPSQDTPGPGGWVIGEEPPTGDPT